MLCLKMDQSTIAKPRAIILVVSITLMYINWGILISLQPTFYPSEAEKRGATPSQYGMLFGTSHLVAFCFAPLFGRFGHLIGIKTIYNSGSFLQAFAGLAFSCLEYIENLKLFLGLSYFLRILFGLADAAIFASILSMLMNIFPNHVTTIASWTEMFFGLGYMIGPALGSSLYIAGGFSLPFLVIGSLALVMAIVLAVVVPKIDSDEKDRLNSSKSTTLTFAALFSNPSIFMPFIDNFICICGNGMIESMLEPHMINEAGSSQLDVGVTFFILGGFYMLGAITTGYVCSKIKYPMFASTIGNLMLALGFTIVGPLPFIPLLPTTDLIYGSSAILGMGTAMVMVSTFGVSQTAAIRAGFNDDLGTYMLISSLWTSSYFLGNFVGPALSGISVGQIGFRATSLILFFIYCANIVIDSLQLLYNYKASTSSEYQPLT